MKKVVDGETTYFHYDADGLLICETDASGNAIRDYVYLNGEPIAMRVAGDWFWFLNDHLGTPRKMVDASGAVVWKATYLPFGKAIVAKADVENNLRFPGQYFDAETGLHYNWHRYYDPSTGRYLTADPIGLAGGINPYQYALNNPTYYVDLDGLNVLAGIIQGGKTGAVIGGPWVGVAGGVIGGTIGYFSGKWLAGVLWNENTENDSCPIPGTTKGRKTKGKTDQREKEGNFDTANEDFDSLNPNSVKDLPNGGRTGILSDGRKVNVRPHSTDGRPTIEIQKEKKKIKIRYGN